MNALTDLVSKQVLLVVAPHAARNAMLELAAVLALRGQLRVLDGGNQFNAYEVARAVRRRTADVPAVLGRIQLSRAFTCYQMAALLQAAPPEPVATVVLDLLATFYDENVPREERRRLLQGCTRDLRRLSRLAPVVVAARPPAAPPGLGALMGQPARAERALLLDILRDGADRVWELEPSVDPPAPPRLF